MKYQTKPNQFTIGKSELYRVKIINAIKVDVSKKNIELIPIENCIEYIQRNHNFFNYKLIQITENMDYFIVGIDDDLKGGNLYSIKEHSDIFYGNAILVKVPKSCNLQKLQKTTLTVEQVKNLIDFK